jgi:predicted esterase
VRGAALDTAPGAFILLHGRGASAHDILQLADALDVSGITYIAPQAAGFTWYPNRFLAPLESNEPWLSSALGNVDDLVGQVESRGIDANRIVIGGFSQGACLALEYVARHPRRYGGVIGWSGGLIGPPGTRWIVNGSLAGTPTFLGCSDVDVHVPADRVRESADALAAAGADVTTILYPGMDHTIDQDEIDHARRILAALPARQPRA